MTISIFRFKTRNIGCINKQISISCTYGCILPTFLEIELLHKYDNDTGRGAWLIHYLYSPFSCDLPKISLFIWSRPLKGNQVFILYFGQCCI